MIEFAGAKKVSPIRCDVDNDFDLSIPSTAFRTVVLSPEVALKQKMESLGYKDYQIDEALINLSRYTAGDRGKITEDKIHAAVNVINVDQITEEDIKRGVEAISSSRVAMIKFAGGLGTSVDAQGAKLAIEAIEGDSFLEIINKQVLSLREEYNCKLPVLLMTSYHTDEEVSKSLRFKNENDIPTTFLQGEAPRLDKATCLPIMCADKKAEMYPPGHGSVFSELYHSGLLQKLHDSGVETIFFSNGDNSAAGLDEGILGRFVASGAPFMSETTPTTDADTKGGYICQDDDGRLMTCETAQLENPVVDYTSDDSPYKHFHINNIYVNVEALLDYMNTHDGHVEMSLVVNKKEVKGKPVLQLENATGSAVHCFKGAMAIDVPRERFLPVKKTCDIMFLRSDAVTYDSKNGSVVPRVQAMPITLDEKYYKSIDDYNSRVTARVSLMECTELDIKGDIHFGEGVVLKGKVRIVNNSSEPVFIKNQVFEGGKVKIKEIKVA